jgi:hypothetical protein
MNIVFDLQVKILLLWQSQQSWKNIKNITPKKILTKNVYFCPFEAQVILSTITKLPLIEGFVSPKMLC